MYKLDKKKGCKIMNNNHYQLLKYCIDNNNIALWNKIKKQCDEYGITIDLEDAKLRYTNLRNADFSNTNLRNADLRFADLFNANLKNANLEYANLENTNLKNADLEFADLFNANLKNADLKNANLNNAIWDGIQIVGLKWCIIIIKNQIQIGCEIHSPEQWEKFNDEEINKMNTNALNWWKQNKKNIFYIYKNFEKLSR